MFAYIRQYPYVFALERWERRLVLVLPFGGEG